MAQEEAVRESEETPPSASVTVQRAGDTMQLHNAAPLGVSSLGTSGSLSHGSDKDSSSVTSQAEAKDEDFPS